VDGHVSISMLDRLLAVTLPIILAVGVSVLGIVATVSWKKRKQPPAVDGPRGIFRPCIPSVTRRIALLLGDHSDALVTLRWQWMATSTEWVQQQFVAYLQSEIETSELWDALPHAAREKVLLDIKALLYSPKFGQLRGRARKHNRDGLQRNMRSDVDVPIFSSEWVMDFVLDAICEEVVAQPLYLDKDPCVQPCPLCEGEPTASPAGAVKNCTIWARVPTCGTWYSWECIEAVTEGIPGDPSRTFACEVCKNAGRPYEYEMSSLHFETVPGTKTNLPSYDGTEKKKKKGRKAKKKQPETRFDDAVNAALDSSRPATSPERLRPMHRDEQTSLDVGYQPEDPMAREPVAQDDYDAHMEWRRGTLAAPADPDADDEAAAQFNARNADRNASAAALRRRRGAAP